MLRWLWLSGAVVAVDQGVKLAVIRSLAEHDRVPVAPFLSWVRWHNEGAAFSILSSAAGWQRWFFIVLAVAFVTFIVYELRRLPAEQRLMGWVYGLIAGGAVGNLVDRVVHGHVVDFVLVHWRDNYFPAFNVADAALTVGAALWIWLMLMEFLRHRQESSS